MQDGMSDVRDVRDVTIAPLPAPRICNAAGVARACAEPAPGVVVVPAYGETIITLLKMTSNYAGRAMKRTCQVAVEKHSPRWPRIPVPAGSW